MCFSLKTLEITEKHVIENGTLPLSTDLPRMTFCVHVFKFFFLSMHITIYIYEETRICLSLDTKDHITCITSFAFFGKYKKFFRTAHSR